MPGPLIMITDNSQKYIVLTVFKQLYLITSAKYCLSDRSALSLSLSLYLNHPHFLMKPVFTMQESSNYFADNSEA